jgi:hypothetical protein
MPRYTFVVLTNPFAGQDETFNQWYDDTHIPDVLRLPGFVAAQRFKLADTSPPQGFSHRYLALYEVDTDDLEEVRKSLAIVAGTDSMILSEAFDRPGALSAYFEPITEGSAAE